MTADAATPASPTPPALSAATLEAAARIMADCDRIAAISALEDGIERTYLTPEHARHNAVAAELMTAAGMRTWQDAAGNQRGRLEGFRPGLPALVLASHLDTVPDAGRYDGILGVLLAIETVARLKDRASELPVALEVVAFADEEGTRFGATLLGSRALAGTWEQDWFALEDKDGITMAEAFTRFGLDPARIADAALGPDEVAGYLEVHIEQGPYLEAADRPLGVVTSIAGARRVTLTILGEARHAGGTPYDRRRDALIGASRAVLDIEQIAREHGAIATVGRLQAYPGGVNVVPGCVEMSLDLRAETDELRDAVLEETLGTIRGFCTERGLTLEVEQIHEASAVRCAPHLMDAVRTGIRSVGDGAGGDDAPLELFSRAGHDAMAMAALTDIGMLFVRCADGISHHPDESVTTEDVAAALDAFEAATLAAAGIR